MYDNPRLVHSQDAVRLETAAVNGVDKLALLRGERRSSPRWNFRISKTRAERVNIRRIQIISGLRWIVEAMLGSGEERRIRLLHRIEEYSSVPLEGHRRFQGRLTGTADWEKASCNASSSWRW
jgi:hypothetical protein